MKCCETILHVHMFRIIPKKNIDLNIVLNCLLLETLGNAFQQLMLFTSFRIISAAKCISINTKRSRARQYLHETLRNAASLTMTRLEDRFPKRFNPWAFGSGRMTVGHVSPENFLLSSSTKLIRIIANLLLQVLLGQKNRDYP